MTASTLTELTRMALPSLPALRPQCMQIVGTGRRHVRGDGGRCVSAGGGSGGGRGSGWSAAVVGTSGGASVSGRAASPGSSVLRRVVRWKDSVIVICRFDDPTVAVVVA